MSPNVTIRAEMRRLTNQHAGICALAWSRDASTLFVASRNGTVTVWDITAGAVRRVLKFKSRLDVYDFGLALAPDGRTLAVGGPYLPLDFRDVDTGAPVALVPIEKRDSTFSLAFSPDGRTFAVSDRTLATSEQDHLRRYDLGARLEISPPLLSSGCTIVSLAFAPDSQTLAAYVADRTLRLFELTTGREAARWPVTSDVTGLTWLPDGRHLVVAHSRSVMLWDVTRGRAVARLKGHTRRVNSVDATTDGRTLATASDDGLVRFWDPTDGACLASFDLEAGRARAVAFAPDGRTVVAAGDDGALVLWAPACAVP
jgi:WD40 repeat protein